MSDLLTDLPPSRLDIPVVRARRETVTLRQASDDAMPTMFGHFSTFDDFYEIDSVFEGHFLERVAPGAFAKTFGENRDNIKVLLEHGFDMEVNDKPLGRATVLKEDRIGAYYENTLYDAAYVRQLVPALEDGQYGSSFRFSVLKDAWEQEPEASLDNPAGLPERTITEVRVYEYGPTVWPANPNATSGARSLTDAHYAAVKRREPQRYDELVRATATARTSAPGGTEAASAPIARRDALQRYRRRFVG